MRRALITGIAGFAGSHLAERLKGRMEIWGVIVDDNTANIAHIGGLNLVKCDLLDYKSVLNVIERARPDVVYHLAGQSAPAQSFKNPRETLNVNIFSTLNVFEAVRGASLTPVIVNIGSGEVYGEASVDELPVKETALLRPVNPYAVSKAAADLLAYQYWRAFGMKIVRVRPFNHFGARQSEGFVASAFAKQVAEIEAGVIKEKVIRTGSLDAVKDFLDVRDVVAAYELLGEKGEYGGAYNVCSGRTVRISEILSTLLSLTEEKIGHEIDPSRLRAAEASVMYGDAGRLKALGWSEGYTLSETLRSLLDYWRARVKA